MIVSPDLRFAEAERIVAHDGTPAFEAVVPPIVQTSLFTFATVADMVETYGGRASREVYSRTTNPTVTLFESKMAALEGADDAIGFPSGMAAISGSVLAFVTPGDRILCVRHVYPGAYRLFETLLKRLGVTAHYVDGGDFAAVEAALPGARLLYLESPTSWTMAAHDVGALAGLAQRHGVMSMIDNSWATPVFQKPLSLGVDLVLHSASKYIGGHSDVVAGVVAGRTDLVAHIRRTICPYIGAKLSPFEAWLLLRGLRTLPARLRLHEEAARTLAQRLAAAPGVAAVYHPALAGPLPPGLAGTGGLFSIVVDETHRKSRGDRMKATLKAVKDGLRRRMHQPIPLQGAWLRQVVTGHFAYYAVPTNSRALSAFRHWVSDLWRRTLRRRSQKDALTWARMARLIGDWLPPPRILHPWPNVRFAVKHPR